MTPSPSLETLKQNSKKKTSKNESIKEYFFWAWCRDHLWYLALAYLDEVHDQWAYDRHLEKYDETLPVHRRLPMFHLDWLNYEQFQELIKDAIEHFQSQTEDITEENIDKYEY